MHEQSRNEKKLSNTPPPDVPMLLENGYDDIFYAV